MPIALIVHGGAWTVPDNQIDAHINGCRSAISAGWERLTAYATAIDAAEVAITILEDDPTFNAGTGAVLNINGEVELDAALMDGRTLAYGAVTNLRRLRNPITLARRVLEGPATALVGESAERFAAACALPLCKNRDLIVERELHRWQRWYASQSEAASSYAASDASFNYAEEHSCSVSHDTVGVIALDHTGNLAAANSTGGMPFKLPGRVGGAPLIGGGLYADESVGACICTGAGESIVRTTLARRAVELLERGLPPQSAAEYAIKFLSRRVPGSKAGCIILDSYGQIGLAWNTHRMAYAYRTVNGEERWGV